VTALPVSKAVHVERLRAAQAAGLEVFGENRVQEAEGKVSRLPGARWQLVGHLQSNKVGRAIEIFDVLHSLDSLALGRRLDELMARQTDGRRLPVYLQVNVDRDPSKEGFDPDELERELPELCALAGLEPLGLMTVGRLVARPEDARPTFSHLRRLAERLRGADSRLGSGLSMGMSDDFEVAVEEGATVVRIGRQIFGQRPAG
jgi:pyridoxal phosphate enzyme (YggS family)